MQRLLPTHVQAKLHVSKPGDPYEQEADRVASQIMRMPMPQNEHEVPCAACANGGAPCPACSAKRGGLVQRRAAGGSRADGALVPDGFVSGLGPGHPLHPATRAFFEQRFGHDFGDVRVHAGTAADRAAQRIDARAFTAGRDIAFQAGEYAPHTAGGRALLAHELTHVVQQGAAHAATTVQRSCADGNCEDCAGGRRDFWITAFFRRRATRRTMTRLRAEINEAKRILDNCCLNLKFDFNWSLLPGGGVVPAGAARPAGDALGPWDYPADLEAIGEGATFTGARGIPMVVADDVPGSGGGVSVLPAFDAEFAGRNFFVLGINQTTTPNPGCNSIAHELWHIAGGLPHDPANGPITDCSGNAVSLTYCNALRALV